MVYHGNAAETGEYLYDPNYTPTRDIEQVVHTGMSREEVVARFRQDLLADPDWVRSVRCELAGEVLGCWCAPRACHAYVLAEVANCSEAHLHKLVGM